MQTKFDYWVWNSAIPKETCQKIINRGLEQIEILKKEGFSTVGSTFGKNHKSENLHIPKNDLTDQDLIEQNINEKEVYIRDSNVSWLNDQWIYDLVWPLIKKANEDAGWNYEFDWAEPAQFTIYGNNQFYGWHSDGANDVWQVKRRKIPGVYDEKIINDVPELFSDIPESIGKLRKLSMSINLTDPNDYDGGNLKFDFGRVRKKEENWEINGEGRNQGSMIIFPSYKYHCVTPVTKGTRYSLVMWFNGRPMK